MRITFEAKLKAGIKHDKDANVYVTYVPALKLYSQGETELQAKTALNDAVASFLLVAYENKLLEKCLHIVGFKNSEGEEKSEQKEDQEDYINITEEMILEKNNFEDVFEVPAYLPPLTADCAA